MTLYDLLKRGERLHADRPAVLFGDEVLTYHKLREQADAVASSLLELGIQKGDKVGVWLPNSGRFLSLYFGITAVGATMVPLNTRYRAHEVSYILRNSEARALFMVPSFLKMDYREMLAEVRPQLEGLQHVVAVDAEDSSDDVGLSWREFVAGSRHCDPEEQRAEDEDVALILYTSGTTGQPKGVMLTHRNLATNARVTGEVMEVTPEDRYFVPLPLFHSFGLVLGCLTPLTFGSSIVLQDVFDAREALELMEKHRCTMNFGVPTMFMLELEEMRKSSYHLSLRSGMMGGAPCPIEVVKGVRQEMGCNVCIGYGITETSPLISLTRYHDDDVQRAESVGRPLPGVEVRIVDDQWRTLPDGEIGEIAIRGNVMKGYYRMPEATREAVDDQGWYYSGDLGKMDAQGYLYITGRKKDMIVVGGFNVYPREIEEVLFTHPGVQNVAVIGVPDPRLGEAVKACIVPRGQVSKEDIREFCRQRMANFKVPTYVEFMDSFPMTASGKIQKYKLREQHDPSQ